MRATQFATLVLLVSMPVCAIGQGAARKRPTAQTATPAEQAAQLVQQIEQYEALLQSADVANSPARVRMVQTEWATASCRLEVLRLPNSLMENPTFAEGVFSSCMERLQAEKPLKQDDRGNEMNGSSSAPCRLRSFATTVNNGETKHTYGVQCDAGVTPRAIAINTSQAQPAISESQGTAFAQGLAAALGIASPIYDSTSSTISFDLPSGASARKFELLLPAASTQLTTATYFIASGAVDDITKCEASPAPAGCSTGAIQIPIPKPKPSTTCPSANTDAALPVPTLKPIETDTAPITGTVEASDGTHPSGYVQLCLTSSDGSKSDGSKTNGSSGSKSSGSKSSGSKSSGSKSGGSTADSSKAGGSSKNNVLLGSAKVSSQDGSFSLPAGKAFGSDDQITAQFFTGTESTPTGYGAVSTAMVVGSCTAEAGKGDAPTFVRGTDNNGKPTYTGTVTSAEASGKVRICKNDTEFVASLDITKQSDGSGTFDATSNVSKADAGDILVAQVVSGSTAAPQYSKVSAGASVGNCSAVQSGDSSTRPTLNSLSAFSDSFSGTMQGAKTGTVVRLCVKDMPFATAVVKDDGTFTGSLPSSLHASQWVTAQEVTTAADVFPQKYGLLGSGQIVSGFAYSSLFSTFIAGVEQSGFSSQGSSTNAFLEAYLRSTYFPMGSERGLAVWGRIRLLGGPLPSGTSVIAAVTNASGTITTSNLANVGQVVDYVFGPELRLKQWDRANGNTDRISLIGGGGATSPLSSNQIQYSLTAPSNNTQGCFQLLNDSPYSYLFANGSAAPGCSLVGKTTNAKISTLAFAPVDRSNFLMKYGAGFRLTHIYPAKNGQAPYSGSLDFMVGQDQQITGGKFHGVVFGVNGVYPLALGSSSLLYLFGSASMKTTSNQTYPPLILGTTQTPTAPLGPSVEVVPLMQPNRDFYRFGVGLNLTSLLCSATKKGCNSNTGSGTGNSNGSATSAGSADNSGSNGSAAGTTDQSKKK